MNYVQFDKACSAVMDIAAVDNETAIDVVVALIEIFELEPIETSFEEAFINFLKTID